jgi:hypothetical protein
MQDIAVYSEKLGFDFETLLSRISACDEKVFEHARKKREEPRGDGTVPGEGVEQRPSDS